VGTMKKNKIYLYLFECEEVDEKNARIVHVYGIDRAYNIVQRFLMKLTPGAFDSITYTTKKERDKLVKEFMKHYDVKFVR
jgi:hypothetical protein